MLHFIETYFYIAFLGIRLCIPILILNIIYIYIFDFYVRLIGEVLSPSEWVFATGEINQIVTPEITDILSNSLSPVIIYSRISTGSRADATLSRLFIYRSHIKKNACFSYVRYDGTVSDN